MLPPKYPSEIFSYVSPPFSVFQTPPPVAEVGLSMFTEFMDNPDNYVSILRNAQKNASREFKN